MTSELQGDSDGMYSRAGLTKSAALRGAQRDVNADERVVAGLELMAAATPETLRTAYPNLYAVHDPSGALRPRAGSSPPLQHVIAGTCRCAFAACSGAPPFAMPIRSFPDA